MFENLSQYLKCRRRIRIAILFLAGVATGGMGWAAGTASSKQASVQWHDLPPLPPAPGQRVQPGVAGAFVGVSADSLIVAGGANFPDKPQLDGGKKTYFADIYVLEKKSDGSFRWNVDPSFKLPHPGGYGGSITLPDGLLCIAGSDAAQCTGNVFLLKWNPAKRAISIDRWPDLPEPTVDTAAAMIGQKIYVAGGKPAVSGSDNRSSRSFWVLDLSRRHQPDEFRWQRLPPLPGPPRSKHILVAQTVGGSDRLFLFSGRTEEPGKPTAFLADAYSYDPALGQWRQLRPVASNLGDGSQGRCIMVGTGMPLPTGEIAIFGGSDGVLYRMSDDLNRRASVVEDALKAAKDPARRRELEQEFATLDAARRKFIAEFPGFSRDVLIYQPATDRWHKAGEFTEIPPVTTAATTWDGGIVIPTGEIIPGIRSNKVWKATFRR